MSLRIRWVRYGRPAAQGLHDTVSAAKGNDPLAIVTVVVPSNHVGVAARRLLGSDALGSLCTRGTGLAAVSFLTVYRLAELLGAEPLAARGRRPVSTPILAAALRQALKRAPGVFDPVATHPATEMTLVAAYRELRDLSPGALDALAARGARAADVVRLHLEARAILEPDWYDEQDLLAAAVARLDNDVGAVPAMGATVLHLPQRVSLHGARLLRGVAERGELTVLAGTTGDERADAEVITSVRRVAGAEGGGDHVPAVEPLSVVSTERTRIVTTSDADEEVRAAVRAVVDAARTGTPLERIAILYATPEPYARLAHEHLAAAGVACNGSAAVPLTARLAGRTLLGLLALPDVSFRREEVFAWLAGARLHDRGRPVPTTAWERLSRQAGVVAGRREWDTLLATYAADAEADADAEESAADPDTPAWRIDRLRTDAVRARELRAFVLGVIDTVAQAATENRTWAQQVAWARRALAGLLGGERRRAEWPRVEQIAAERVERAVDRLASLDAVEPRAPLDVFSRTLRAELEADLGRVGRMGEGVLVGSVSMGVGLDLDLVVVLGLAEGTFPAAVREDTLLPDDERAASGDELGLRAADVERQHRQLLATLAGAARHLLCVPRGDLRRSSDRVPSRWVTEIASTLAGERWWGSDLLIAARPWIVHVASFDAGLRQMDFPADEQEYRLRALLAEPDPGRALAAVDDTVLAAAHTLTQGRRSHEFTRFDGNLSGWPVPSPADNVVSATRLEGWAHCPFAYLLRDVLRVEDVENPEDRLMISPLDRGNLVHEALEKFIAEVLDRAPTEQPAPSQPWTDADRRRMVQIADALCDRFEAHGLTGRPIFWQRDRRRIVAELDRFLELDSARRADSGLRPVAAELAFGMRGSALGTVALSLPDSRSVEFRGKADRVDMAADGTIHVVDYKTGRADDYAGLSEDNPDCGGTRLQLVVYGMAARQFRGTPDAPAYAEYWFTSTRGGFRHIGYRVTTAVRRRVSTAVGRIVDGIEAGVFPNHPTTISTSIFVDCAYCDPDALGVTGLRRQIDAKRADPALAPFLALVDPQLDDESQADTAAVLGDDDA